MSINNPDYIGRTDEVLTVGQTASFDVHTPPTGTTQEIKSGSLKGVVASIFTLGVSTKRYVTLTEGTVIELR